MKISQYTQTGHYHQTRGELCQDIVFYGDTGEYTVVVAADGVTSCTYSKKGAEIACKAAIDFVKSERAHVFDYADEKLAYLLLEYVLLCLEMASGATGNALQEYASTLAMVCIEKKTGKARLFNLGDGAIFSICGAELKTLLPPKRHGGGPCLTTTAGAYHAAEVRSTTLPLNDTLLLCSDGFLHILNSNAQNRQTMRASLGERAFTDLNKQLDAANAPDDCCYIAVTRTRK